MPQFRPQAPPPDRGRAARRVTDTLAAPRAAEDLPGLIRDAGGPRNAAQLPGVGRSTRQLQRWARGEVQQVPNSARRALARASLAARQSRVIEALGGKQRAAEIYGRTVRTIERYATGEIRLPRGTALRAFQRAEAALRMRGRGLNVDPATGRPVTPVHVALSNSAIRVNPDRTRPYSYDSRSIGGGVDPLGVLITPEVFADITDAVGRGDERGAHRILEQYLTTEYAGLLTYDEQNAVGLFIDRIGQIDFTQEPEA